jgi:hypothetical protein
VSRRNLKRRADGGKLGGEEQGYRKAIGIGRNPSSEERSLSLAYVLRPAGFAVTAPRSGVDSNCRSS